MLTLQKASAGSGKTYALARQYIIFLLTDADDDGNRTLREDADLREAVSHILAITFTNKATAEMKDRIVKRLADLADPNLPEDKTPYLSELQKIVPDDVKTIRGVAAKALSYLLNNYSDFHVSTIDSFFQSVLRTFAYEVDIDDSYELELDSDYLTKDAIDSILSEINSPDAPADKVRWMKLLMELSSDAGETWNIFSKSEGEKSLYIKVFDAAKQLQNERFRHLREQLFDWFEKHPDFIDRFEKYQRQTVEHTQTLIRDAKRYAAEVLKALRGFDAAELNKNICSNMRRFLNDPLIYKKSDRFVAYDPVVPKNVFKADFYKKNSGLPEVENGMRAAENFHKIYSQLISEHESEASQLWDLYSAGLKFLWLTVQISMRISENIRERGIVEMAETNSILSKIIGDDDTPFIYERLGSRLEHYLIDEFQDTSDNQWRNLRPLIEESMSFNRDNLIIGDAKQSIYRFRGAEPSLIMDVVPRNFAGSIINRGDSVEDNTNHRSLPAVVRFNNSLFTRLSEHFDELERNENVSEDILSPGFFKGLYGNVAQQYVDPKGKGVGYVEIRGVGKKEESYEYIGPLISDLLQRGYHKRDIAVLMRTNKAIGKIIDALLDYNRNLPEGEEPITFVSEESLRISSAPSVNTILVELDKIVRFDGDDETVSELRTLPLPWLIERIIEEHIAEDERRRDALFISAFQDEVVDYCRTYNSDPASFLLWWKRRGESKNVMAAEGNDDVTLMTIHKSKGLEFKCVILPEISATIEPTSSYPETMFLPSYPAHLNPPMEEDDLPPLIPVDLHSGTRKIRVYLDEYIKFLRKFRMDYLNTLYVASTRAVGELYIFLPETHFLIKKVLPTICTTGKDLCLAEGQGVYNPEDEDSIEKRVLFTTGRPLDDEEIEKLCKTEECDDVDLDDYYVRSPASFLRFRPAKLPSDNAREKGTVLHSVMSSIQTIDDLDTALEQSRVAGDLSGSQCEEIREMLRRRFDDPMVASWFAPGLRVVNERPMLTKGRKNRVPDRVVIDPEGNAVIVDYKFGSARKDDDYSSQLRSYIKGLRDSSPEGFNGSIKAYIWYVTLDTIVPVEERG